MTQAGIAFLHIGCSFPGMWLVMEVRSCVVIQGKKIILNGSYRPSYPMGLDRGETDRGSVQKYNTIHELLQYESSAIYRYKMTD